MTGVREKRMKEKRHVRWKNGYSCIWITEAVISRRGWLKRNVWLFLEEQALRGEFLFFPKRPSRVFYFIDENERNLNDEFREMVEEEVDRIEIQFPVLI